MTATLLRIAWLSLKRDRVALVLTFILPIVFFSIFAGIFGNMGGSGALPAVSVTLVDEEDSQNSRDLIAAVVALEGLKGPGKEPRPSQLADRNAARQLVEEGTCDVAVIVPAGYGAESPNEPANGNTHVIVLADTIANPVAHEVVRGLLQQAAMNASPGRMAQRGISLFERYAGPLSEAQHEAVAGWSQAMKSEDSSGEVNQAMLPVQVTVEDVRVVDESQERRSRMVAFQAAGIGVMFLLFSMTRAAGTLLEEERTGTLERLLNSRLDMGALLTGYWLFAAVMGFVQMTIMFLWGWAVFGLELWTIDHLTGFAIMTLATTAAAAALGLALGTACRTSSQLSGLSTLLVLVMSAVGGSMVPRFVLRENALFDKLGLLTFNAWAIDGYQKVFWYESGLLSLWPQVAVLLVLTVVSLGLARWLARRWEAT